MQHFLNKEDSNQGSLLIKKNWEKGPTNLLNDEGMWMETGAWYL